MVTVTKQKYEDEYISFHEELEKEVNASAYYATLHLLNSKKLIWRDITKLLTLRLTTISRQAVSSKNRN